MRWPALYFAAMGALFLSMPAPAADPVETKCALESDATGWVDLLAHDLKDWHRVPGGKKRVLGPRNVWSLDAQTKILKCDAASRGDEAFIHEKLHWNKEQTDGIIHVEWRFKKIAPGKPVGMGSGFSWSKKENYNSGLYIRNAADGKIWHQAQIGKNIGHLFGNTLVEGKAVRFRKDTNLPVRAKAIGEWNTFEVTFKGKELTLWINGAVTAEWKDCQVLKGYVGLEAEGFDIEFRNVKLKEMK